MAYTPPPAGATASTRGLLRLTNDLGGTADAPTVPVAARVTGGGQETISTVTSTASTTLNLANGNVFNVTLAVATTTFAFSGATSGKACSFAVYLKQDSTGSRAVVWPSSAKWAGGTAPTISTAANAVDIVVFESLDGGTNWYGSLVGTAFA